MKSMRDPVARLGKALYGHKHSGVYWQRYCRQQVEEAGFTQVSENWPCIFYNYKTNMLLIVYVDDMKLAGPKHLMEQTWKDLGRKIKLETPKGDSQEESEDGSSQMTFLGCTIRRKKRLLRGRWITTVEYYVEDSLRKCLRKYEEVVEKLTGLVPRYQRADTPFLEESTKQCV